MTMVNFCVKICILSGNIGETMRICQFTEATTAGVFTHITQLSEHMKINHVEQTFLLSSLQNPDLNRRDEFHGNRLLIFDIKRSRNPVYFLNRLVKLIKILREERFNILHCHSSFAGIYGRLAGCFVPEMKIVYTPHSFSFNQKTSKIIRTLLEFLERTLSLITDSIVCVSESEYKRACDIGISQQKLTVIKNGISKVTANLNKQNWLVKHGYDHNTRIVGFIGRLSRQKRPDVFIQALRDSKLSHVCFVIVGNGPEYEMVRSMTQDYPFTLVTEAKGAEIVQIFDVYVNTSDWEAMPYTILEAMIHGIPVIATKIPDVMELIKDNNTGFLVNSGDTKQLADKIDEILYNKEKLDVIGENGRKMVESQHSIEQMIARTLDLYNRLVIK